MSIRQRIRRGKDRLNTTLDSFEEFTTLYFLWVLSVSRGLATEIRLTFEPLFKPFDKILPSGHGGQVDTVITVVIIGVIAVVGILIYSEVNSNISVTGTLSSSQTNLTDGFGDAIDLVPIVMIVLVAALVIGVISRFR